MSASAPLLTLALNCYKCERFVAKAIDGAFAQTYSPLEIVISDDCSPDRTWAIIKEKAAAYTGPHKIVLNRNERNLGLARHQNRIFELCHGEWIAFQAGDDVSLPARMELVAEEVGKNPKIRCLSSHVIAIDGDGALIEIPQKLLSSGGRRGKKLFGGKNAPPHILGASAVYHRDVYDYFGPLAAHVANEDHVLPLRAGLLGEIAFIAAPTLYYRKHDQNHSGNNLSGRPQDKLFPARYRLRFLYTLYQELADLAWFEQDHPQAFRLIDCYRRQIEDDILLNRVLGSFRLHSQMRLFIFFKCLFSLRIWLLFFRRGVKRMLMKR